LALSTSSNFSIILAILSGKLAKTPAKAEATLAYELTGIFCCGFERPDFCPAIMNLSKIMFRLVYIKWILRDGDQNEYRDF
jgi:hypothetical protein